MLSLNGSFLILYGFPSVVHTTLLIKITTISCVLFQKLKLFSWPDVYSQKCYISDDDILTINMNEGISVHFHGDFHGI